MGKDLEDFKRYELYPALFKAADLAFPEMEFRKQYGNWISKHHLNGELDGGGERPAGDITYIYDKSGGYVSNQRCAVDHSRGQSKSLVDLYKDLHQCTFMEAIQALSKIAGVEPPAYDSEQWEQRRKEEKERERWQEKFTTALWEDTPAARAVLDYLTKERQFTLEEVKAAGFGLINEELVAKIRPRWIPIGVETTHPLTICYRSGDRIDGFKFRVIDKPTEGQTKYKNSVGLKKGTTLFGLPCTTDRVVIVEGELDAIHAQVKGAANVVATTGGKATEKQIGDAIRMGVNTFTLLFDNDKAGREFVSETIETIGKYRADRIIKGGDLINIYIASLPEEYKDPDQFLASNTGEEFTAALEDSAVKFPVYRTECILKEYEEIAKQNGGQLTAIERDQLFRDLYKFQLSEYVDEYDRKQVEDLIYYHGLDQETQLNFRLEDFRGWIDKYKQEQRDQQRSEQLKQAIDAAGSLQAAGKVTDALELLEKSTARIKQTGSAADYVDAFRTYSSEELDSYLSKTKKGLPTGYYFSRMKNGVRVEEDDELTLNTGLTFVCGYRGHCKTSFLNNVAIHEATRNLKEGTGRKVLYFSYEVDKRRLMLDLLNTFVDVEMNANPLRTISTYFREGERAARGYLAGCEEEKAANWSKFVQGKDTFLDHYLASGALTVIEKNYTIEELLPAIKWYQSYNEVSLVCIDYAQLLYSSQYSRQRTEEIKYIVNQLKTFANEEGLPVLLAAQFNRQVLSPASVETQNIGEGGDFERIADTCIGLFNLKELKPTGDNAEDKEAKRVLHDLGVLEKTGEKTIEDLAPKDRLLFARIMKRRYGDFPVDAVFNFKGATKKITNRVTKEPSGYNLMQYQ